MRGPDMDQSVGSAHDFAARTAGSQPPPEPVSPRGQDARTGLYQWLPDKWNTAKNYEELAHPAVRAAGIYISADPAH